MSAGLPSDRDEVTLRCGRCARDLGTDAPALAVCVRVARDGRWYVMVFERLNPSRRRHPAYQRQVFQAGNRRELFDSVTAPAARKSAGVVRPGSRSALRIAAGGLNLACRRCGYQPPARRRRLYELADQALAAGRRDAYA